MSVGREMITGVFWSAVQKYSGIIVQIGITAILARLLYPEDFGVIAIASVLIHFFSLFTDMGIGAAIIQNQDLSGKDLNSIFTFSIYVGIVLSALFFFASPLTGSAYHNGSLAGICRILSVNLLFASWNIVPNALINKNKRFKFIAQRTLGLQVLCGISAVAAAFGGLDIYALVVSPLFTSIGTFCLNYRQYPLKFTGAVEFSSLKKISSFSIYQFLFNFINYFSRNLDKLIIGKSFSMNELGYYEKSYQLMLLPMQNITHVITPVMHPILASLQGNYPELTEKYHKIVRLVATLSFPAGIFLYFSAEDLITLIYGQKWAPAIPVFEILALSVPLQMILSTIGSIYQSSGKVNYQFYGGVSNSCCTIAGFVVATSIFHNLEAMAWAWTITLTVNFGISFAILYKLALKQRLSTLLSQCVRPLLFSNVLIIILLLLRHRCNDWTNVASLLAIFSICAMYLLAYMAFAYKDKIPQICNFILHNHLK